MDHIERAKTRSENTEHLRDCFKNTPFIRDINMKFAYGVFDIYRKHSLFDEEYYQWHTQRQLKKLNKKRS